MVRSALTLTLFFLLVLVGKPCPADYVAEVTADNPMAWWRFEDASSDAGSTAADTAGPYNGTYNGHIQLNNGVVGQSAWFDGDLDYVAVGPMGTLPVQGSIELWLRTDAVQNYRNVFTTGPLGGLTSGNNAIRFEEHATGDFLLAIGDDSGGLPDFVVSLTPAIMVGGWYHVVVTWDTAAGVVNGYINGQRIIADEPNAFWPAELSDVKIGIGYALWAERSWLGNADEVAIYDHMLNEARVQAHFEAVGLISVHDIESWKMALAAAPNPFNPRTTLRFSLPRPAAVELVAFDLRGRRVRELMAGVLPVGPHQVTWDGRDDAQLDLASGIYHVRLNAGGRSAITRLVLVR
jgi:hypothetical protein